MKNPHLEKYLFFSRNKLKNISSILFKNLKKKKQLTNERDITTNLQKIACANLRQIFLLFATFP